MPRIRPYSRPPALAKLDHRTREARYMAARRAELTAHVGGNPSAVHKMLIERIVWLSVQVAMLDVKQAEGATFTPHDATQYLSWCGTLSRLLRELGPAVPSASGRPTLQEHLARRAAERSSAA